MSETRPVAFIKMDISGVPREVDVEMVEILGSEVLPLLNADTRPAVAANARAKCAGLNAANSERSFFPSFMYV